jgi:four helix bundle protein
VIQAVRSLTDDAATRVLAYQLTKAATSVGANIEEADGAESRRDFIHKLSIARKEARETRFWLRLIGATVPYDEWTVLQRESEEITRIISAIIRSTRRNG